MKKPSTKKELSVERILGLHHQDMKRYVGALSEEFQGRISVVAEQFGGVNQKLDDLTKKVDMHTEMIGRMMVQLQEIQSDMKQKVDLQQFARLEKRVALLEAGRR